MFNSFGRLRISTKLWISSIVFSLPISVLLYFVITGINYSIRFARLETYGNEYQRPLEVLLHYLPEHERMARLHIVAGGGALDEITAMEQKIDKAFSDLSDVDGRLGEDLQFTEEGLGKRGRSHLRAPALKSKWEAAKSWREMSPREIAEHHDTLIGDIRNTITHSGDTSNLILDPDLDSYYLMDATLLALPQTQDRLGKAISSFEDRLRKGEFSTEERVQAFVQASLLGESDLDRITSSLKTALNEDANFHGISESLQKRVPPALEEYRKSNSKFIEALKAIGAGESGNGGVAPEPERFAALGGKAREDAYKLWSVTAEELDILLERRIAHYRHNRIIALCATALALGVAVLLVSAIGRSIVGPLRRLTGETHRIAYGLRGLKDRIDESGTGAASGEELRTMSDSFNQMVKELSHIIGKVNIAATGVNSSIARISAAIEEQAAVLAEQSASVAEITSTMEEFSASSRQISEYSGSVVKIATKALDNTRSGADAVVTVTEKMKEIAEDNQANIEEIIKLGKKSKDIARIMQIINSIADQTKLIAFNAAIEASSAGEAGRRFGVVAGEIRRLADTVMGSTEEIDNTIVSIQSDINRLVMVSEKSAQKVMEGLAQSDQTAQRLRAVVDAADATLSAARQISMATLQQESAGEQVLTALREINEGAIQTSNSIGEINSNTIDLMKSSQALKDLVEQFRLEDVAAVN